MKIFGIGVDIVEKRRIKNLIKDKKFLKRIYSENEIKFSKKIRKKTDYFANRFAAKESFSKTLGTGFRFHLNY